MSDLTEKWKAGELESLGELIKQIEGVDNRRTLSDEYLIERNEAPRSEYAPAEEWGYGIVWAMSDYVLPYLKELNALKGENASLKGLLKECKFAVDEYRESLVDDTSDFAKGRVKEMQRTFNQD